MIRAENITYLAGNKKLLDDVSLEFEPGKLNLIIGPNGAGKSTLVKVLSHQLIPQKGKYYLESIISTQFHLLRWHAQEPCCRKTLI